MKHSIQRNSESTENYHQILNYLYSILKSKFNLKTLDFTNNSHTTVPNTQQSPAKSSLIQNQIFRFNLTRPTPKINTNLSKKPKIPNKFVQNQEKLQTTISNPQFRVTTSQTSSHNHPRHINFSKLLKKIKNPKFTFKP